jgi:oxaloacetate decarboxylase alpha subunit
LLAPLDKPRPAYSFHTNPLHELLRYVGSRNDVSYARVRFGQTEITLSA